MGEALRTGSLIVAGLLLSGCPADATLLVVDVRTDLVPGVEFDAIRTEIIRGGAAGLFFDHELEPGADYLTGQRVAELVELDPGSVLVRVSLLRETATILQRPVRVSFEGSFAVTVPLYRNCLGVECPAPGGDPVAAACVAGMCADETCTEETPELCPDPGCVSDADCAAGSSCSVGSCGVGGCAYVADDDLCDPEETCDLVDGCVAGAPPCDPFPGTELGLHANGATTCVHSMDEPLRCWGANSAFLGDPVGPVGQVREVEPSLRLFSFALGANHWCGVNSMTGVVECAGEDWAGQLGDGEGESPHGAPAPVFGGIVVETITAGFATVCAVASTRFGLCWGQNERVQLGIGGGTPSEVWVPTSLAPTGGDWLMIAAGHQHSCGVATGGRVDCWGSNTNEQLGVDVMLPQSAFPMVVMGLTGPFVTAAVGFEYSLALAADGTLWSWGANLYGQLGRSDSFGGGTFTPGEMEGAWVAVAAGYRHACGIRTGGGLFCWGDNDSGQLGPMTDAPFQWQPSPVMPEREFVGVAVGGDHSCGLDVSGRVWCWGSNASSQLTGAAGIGSSSPVNVCPN